MKKFSYILFIATYLIFNIGISVATHFCGNEINTTIDLTTVSAEDYQDCCADGCLPLSCPTDLTELKITDLYNNDTNKKTGNAASEFISLVQSEDLEEPSQINYANIELNTSFSTSPIFLNNCSFRI